MQFLLAATEGEGGGKSNGWIMWVIIAVVLVLMIVLTIVPQKKRQKEQQNMMNSLTVGTKIMTIGRMVGRIVQVNPDNTLIVNVGTELNPTLIVIDKQAVGLVLENVAAPQAEPAAAEPAAVSAPTQESAPEEEPAAVEDTVEQEELDDETAEEPAITDTEDSAVEDMFEPANKSKRKKK